MKEMKTVRFVTIGGLLTALTVFFQSAPVLLPTVGLALSPLSTLPVALAAVMNISLGITVWFSSVLIMIIVSPQEAIILLTTTGLQGIVMGAVLYRKGMIFSILSSTIVLPAGMLVLTYVAGVPALGSSTSTLSLSLTLLIFTVFSLIYVSIWNICFSKFASYLIKVMKRY